MAFPQEEVREALSRPSWFSIPVQGSSSGEGRTQMKETRELLIWEMRGQAGGLWGGLLPCFGLAIPFIKVVRYTHIL